MARISKVGEGTVVLLQGGGKVFTDVAARFVRSEKSLSEILSTPYDRQLVENIVSSNHGAATEFDYYIFGVEGYARVTEVQLVRKRLASYLIKSGRPNKKGKRSYDVVLPEAVWGHSAQCPVKTQDVYIPGYGPLELFLHGTMIDTDEVQVNFSCESLINVLESWYEEGVARGLKEEELRYMKPQATEFKAIVGMNAHALKDWFQIRLCLNAQTEIRDLATKMFSLVKEATPDVFKGVGPSCAVLGYCPENRLQNVQCRGKIPTKEQALRVLKDIKDWSEV